MAQAAHLPCTHALSFQHNSSTREVEKGEWQIQDLSNIVRVCCKDKQKVEKEEDM